MSDGSQVLQRLIDNGTIKVDGTALNEMLKKEKEKQVIEKFGEPFKTNRKKGAGTVTYYRRDIYIEPGKRKTITASTREELINKLYAL